MSRPCVGGFPHPYFQPAGARVWAEQPCGSGNSGAGIVPCSRRHIDASSFSIALPCPKAFPASGFDAIMDWTISQSLAGRGCGCGRRQVQAMPDSLAAQMPQTDVVRLSPCCSVRTSTKCGLATISARQRRLSRGSTHFPGFTGNRRTYPGALIGGHKPPRGQLSRRGPTVVRCTSGHKAAPETGVADRGGTCLDLP